jgi:hypothetical protein
MERHPLQTETTYWLRVTGTTPQEEMVRQRTTERRRAACGKRRGCELLDRWPTGRVVWPVMIACRSRMNCHRLNRLRRVLPVMLHAIRRQGESSDNASLRAGAGTTLSGILDCATKPVTSSPSANGRPAKQRPAASRSTEGIDAWVRRVVETGHHNQDTGIARYAA